MKPQQANAIPNLEPTTSPASIQTAGQQIGAVQAPPSNDTSQRDAQRSTTQAPSPTSASMPMFRPAQVHPAAARSPLSRSGPECHPTFPSTGIGTSIELQPHEQERHWEHDFECERTARTAVHLANTRHPFKRRTHLLRPPGDPTMPPQGSEPNGGLITLASTTSNVAKAVEQSEPDISRQDTEQNGLDAKPIPGLVRQDQAQSQAQGLPNAQRDAQPQIQRPMAPRPRSQL